MVTWAKDSKQLWPKASLPPGCWGHPFPQCPEYPGACSFGQAAEVWEGHTEDGWGGGWGLLTGGLPPWRRSKQGAAAGTCCQPAPVAALPGPYALLAVGKSQEEMILGGPKR